MPFGQFYTQKSDLLNLVDSWSTFFSLKLIDNLSVRWTDVKYHPHPKFAFWVYFISFVIAIRSHDSTYRDYHRVLLQIYSNNTEQLSVTFIVYVIIHGSYLINYSTTMSKTLYLSSQQLFPAYIHICKWKSPGPAQQEISIQIYAGNQLKVATL